MSARLFAADHSRFKQLFELSPDPAWIIDDTRFVECNEAAVRTLGYASRVELRNAHPSKLSPPRQPDGEDSYVKAERMMAIAEDQGLHRFEWLHTKADGTNLVAEVTLSAIELQGRQVIYCVWRDISERKIAEAKIKRLTQLYAALSQCNQAIVRCASEEELLPNICRVAVQFGGMKMAWIGLVDPDTRMVRPVANFGDRADEYLQGVEISVDGDSPLGRGPTGIAIREKQPVWCQDFQNDPHTVPWHERGTRLGWRASASLPLQRNSVPIGALTLYADEVDAFDKDVRHLLVEMATDISFALDNLAHESQRRRTEEEIQFKNAILQTQQETSLDAMLVVDENGQIISYNQQFIELWRLSPQLVSARVDAPVLQSVVEQVENSEAFLRRVQYLNEHRDDKSREEVLLKDGRTINRYSAPVVGANRKYYGRVWYFRDVTERKKADQKFKDLLESAPDAMVIVNPDAEIVLVNAQAVKLFGWSREELLGQKIDMLVPERFRAEHQENQKIFFAQPRARAMGAGLDLFGLRKDGTKFPVDISLSPLETNDGTLAITAIRDITERKQAEHALRTSEERFKTMFVQAPVGIALIDSLTGQIDEVNPRFAEIAGRSMEEMATIDWLQITHRDDVQGDLEHMALLNTGKIDGFQIEKRYLYPDGTDVWVNMAIAPLKVEDKAHPRHLCMIQDITERKIAERTIAHLNRVHSVLIRTNTLIVRVKDRDQLFRNACQIAVEAGGFRMSFIGIVDQSTMKVVPVASVGKDEELLTAIKSILSSSEGASKTMVARAIRDKKAVVSNDSQNDPRVLFGKIYVQSAVRSMAVLPLIVADEAIGVIALYASEIGFFQEEEMKLLSQLAGDIAFAIDHIEKQERLDYLAYYDALTGLANRSLFLERVGQYMRSALTGGHKLVLFLIDLERFKSINDSLGWTAGDALLKQVAQWLTRKAGHANLLARIDADHFAIVLPEVSSGGDLSRFVEKMSAAFLEHPFRLNDAVFRIAVKVGAALFPDNGADADTLFRNAEAALKKAKASGERYLFYTQKMTATVAGNLTLENQLRRALDNEEFVLHYQPKVNLVSGKMTSAEALIRWNDPRTGLVPPGKFIPILEETGLIYEVGRWALKKAIGDYLRWRAAGLPAVPIAVNVSPLQLRNRGFVDEIGQVISIDAHAPAGLELEITESLIMEDVKHNISSLQAIRAMDVTIAIDDFGTGFSSLSYLARLPVDTLKIDRSFVIAMTADPEGLALVSTIISLAHSLKLKVVAEGVETEEQSRLLRLLNCDEMQGFLFSQPVPGETFETRFLAPPPGG